MSFNVKGVAGYISGHNFNDENGNPAGGCVQGSGFRIDWQDGPLGRDDERTVANGAFVEDVVKAVLTRMQYYQGGRFACRENALVITKLEEAIHWMEHRTKDREERKVEGLHEE